MYFLVADTIETTGKEVCRPLVGSQIGRHHHDSRVDVYKRQPVTEAIEYICDSNWQLFRDKLPVQKGTATINGAKITTSGWKNVVAYEVYEGDELIFVSNRNTFTLDSPTTSHTKVYAVAYNGDKTEVHF